MKNRVLCFLLVLLLAATAFPCAVFAEGESENTAAVYDSVGGVYYDTIEEAFAQGQLDGYSYANLELLKNIEVNTTLVNNGKGILVDFKGHKITGAEGVSPVIQAKGMTVLMDTVGGGGVYAASKDLVAVEGSVFLTTINSGTYLGKISINPALEGVDVILGGSFNPVPDKSIYDIEAGDFAYNEATGFYDFTKYAAIVNSAVKKVTLQDAIDSAAERSVIKLLDDCSADGKAFTVAEDDDITIDLAGHRLSGSSYYLPENGALIVNKGKLTLIDSDENSQGYINAVQSDVTDPETGVTAVRSVNVIDNSGTLTVRDNIEIRLSGVNEETTGVIINNSASGTVNIEAGSYPLGAEGNTGALATGEIIKNEAGGKINITGGSFISDVSGYLSDWYYTKKVQYAHKVFTDSVSESTGDNEYVMVNYDFYDVTKKTVADTVKIVFEKSNGATEDSSQKLYDIKLVCDSDKVINRLNSVDLTFDFDYTADVKKMSYEIFAADEMQLSTHEDFANRYMFSFEDKDGDEKDTGSELTIGQVLFKGYGTFSFSVDADVSGDDMNIVNATKTANNIVDTYVVGGDIESGVGNFDISHKITDKIEIVRSRLEINIAFPNSIENNVSKYQDMKVTVSGAELAENIVIPLGTDSDSSMVTFENGAYRVVIDNTLIKSFTYNVTITGAGYRTARYTVTMRNDDGTVLNFWNNVMDNEAYIEEGRTKTKVNFLAGDIVADDNINIYDLSAVVSYFETVNDTSDASVYARYDLNRDGIINSKDVAYVLVSWDN